MRDVTDQAAGGPDRPARSYRVEALAKGLRLLSYFTAQRPGLHVKDLVALSGIPMPTVFRLVATLTEEGYLERTVDGMVRPGTGMLALGFADPRAQLDRRPDQAGRRHRVGRGQRGRAERRVRQRAAHQPTARAAPRRQPRDLPPHGRRRPRVHGQYRRILK
jgi:hypothetical protein